MRRTVDLLLLSCFAFLVARGDVRAQTTDLGQIDFPTSGSAEAQLHFLRGVLLLHSFEYDDAGEAFREAQKVQPDFAMAYWGEAMTYNHPIWNQEDVEAARKALARLAPTADERRAKARTAREKDFIRCVEVLYGEEQCDVRRTRYRDAMGRMRKRYPDDDEVTAFYALSILGARAGQRDIPTYMQAAAVAEEAYQENPKHPGALHYLIHSYDDPIHAPLGLRMARTYAKVAPAAAHALHMPSHIYVALGMWEESAASNEASSAAADARIERKGLTLEDRGYHSIWWLAYTYLQLGRHKEAGALLDRMTKDAAKSGTQRTRGHLALMRAAHLVGTRAWDSEATRIRVDTDELRPTTVAADRFVTAVAAAKRGDITSAEEALSALRDIEPPQVVSLESKAPVIGFASCCMPALGRDPGFSARQLEGVRVMELELAALIARAAGKKDEALRLAERATAAEDAMRYDYGPPLVVKPAHELAGELSLEVGTPREARKHFEAALSRAPRRSASLLGLARAAHRAGDVETARETYAELRSIWHRADPELPGLGEVRDGAGR